MLQLGISAACAYVRKVLDELTSVEEIGMLASPDAVDLHKLVEGAIVEAAVKVHSNAPSILLDGIKGVIGVDYDVTISEDNVATITMLKDTVRIASVKADDSSVVVCDLIPEDSAEGRKQLNPYVRGVHDDPRVVLNKVWADSHKPVLTYYTVTYQAAELSVEYVPYPEIDETIILISPQLQYAVLNELAAMVCDSLGETDKAALCRAKSKEYMEGK